jgi:Na+/H+-dicarboxylate symporter
MEKAERWYTKLHWQVALGLVVGVTLGVLLGEAAVPWYEWVGEVFLRLLKMVVVPLVFASITVGVIRLGSPKEVGRLGGVTLLYYLATSCLAIGAGLLVVNVFSPGVGLERSLLSSAGEIKQGSLTAHDLLMKWIPDNPLRTFTLFGTEEAGAGYAMLGIIFFGIVFGLATSATGGKHAARLEGVLDAVFEVMMTMTRVIIRMAPLGVASLVGATLARTGIEVVLPMMGYMATVLVGLSIHFFGTLPLLLYLFGGWNPWTYMRHMSSALATAFSSASSNATLPTTMECAEKEAGLDPRVVSFVLPMGATVNMDGTALYESVAAIFIANLYGIHLGVSGQILVFVTALVTSIGAAGIPHSSMVMLTIIFRAVGLPLEGIGLIFAVDRVLDMCRTATNVWSDAVGAAVINRFHGWLARRVAVHAPTNPDR